MSSQMFYEPDQYYQNDNQDLNGHGAAGISEQLDQVRVYALKVV